jgi:type II secretory pathway pseudopilin PulG
MTLIELLVVVAILGLLSVVVLPNLSNTGDARKAREAARGVSGFVAATQSRAIGTRGGSGLWIEPLPNVITDAQGIEHLVAIDLFAATIPRPYSGESLDAAVIVAPSGAMGNIAGLTFVPGGSFLQPPTLATASNAFIRFAGSPATFRLEPSGGSAWQARMITVRNQTVYNTPWPVTGPLGIAYEMIVDATKDPSVTMSLGNAIAIDLTWTQLGSATPWGLSSGTIPLPIRASQVLYDSAGRPTNAVRSGGLAEPMIDPVCLLVAPLEMIQEATCFTKPGAYWVAIDPRGGAPRVAEVQVLSAAALDGKNRPASTAALITSQALVRQSTFQEGR